MAAPRGGPSVPSMTLTRTLAIVLALDVTTGTGEARWVLRVPPDDEDLDAARASLAGVGRWIGRHRIEATDRTGEVCARFDNEETANRVPGGSS